MKTKLLKKFRKEFFDSVKIKPFLSRFSGCAEAIIDFPDIQCTIGSFVIRCLQPWEFVEDLNGDYSQLPDKIISKIYDSIDEYMTKTYHTFMEAKIKNYKEAHPYKGISIKVFKRKRRL